MTSKFEKPVESRLFPFIVLFAAGCFLFYLLSNARVDVFFSGDAGLKFLVLKQVLQNGHFDSTDPSRQGWVNELWSEGFYPFKPPFVYNLERNYVVSFPPFFQWLNAPVYYVLGYKGLYFIPATSLFLLWCWFVAAMRRLKVGSLLASVGLLLMVFGSPLTVYGAMYWEHTLSVLLSFAGIVFLVSEPVSRLRCVLLGVLTGCSGLLRPELIVLSGFFIIAAFYRFRNTRQVEHFLFAFSALAVIVYYFCFNIFLYGSAFGAHGKQLIDDGSLAETLQRGLTQLVHLNAKFIAYFPVSLLYYCFALHLLVKRPVVRPVVLQLVVISTLYALIVPFLMPNGGGKQWSPRYFLPLVPLVLITLCLSAEYLKVLLKNHQWIRIAIWVMFITGVYLNTISAASTLARDYRYRVTPAMNFLKGESCHVVVVQNQYITQELAALFKQKSFFLAEDQNTLGVLFGKLKTAGVKEVIYISSAQENALLPNQLNHRRTNLRQIGNYFVGKYSLSAEHSE